MNEVKTIETPKEILNGILQNPNSADRLVKYFSPERYIKRVKARYAVASVSSFVGSSKTRKATKNWNTSPGDADADILDTLDDLVQRSRDLVRNNPIAAGATLTKNISVIGTGLRLQSKISKLFAGIPVEERQAIERDIEFKFKMWGESFNCDVSKQLNFSGFQQLGYRQKQENGGFLALFTFVKTKNYPFTLALQLIEADRLSNPNNQRDGAEVSADNKNKVFGGVEKDSTGAVIAYHIRKTHPGAINTDGKSEWARITAFNEGTGLPNILHVYQILRPGQSRGLPDLTPVIEPLKELGTYTEAELRAAVVSGLFTVFIKTEDGDSGDSGITVSNNPADTGEIALGSGAVVDLASNESIETANPGRPNTAFDPFTTAILREIGVGLGLPFEILIKHFTASYSASKAAILEAWRFFRSERKWFIDSFCQPVFEAWLYEAVLRGIIKAPGFLSDPYIRKAYSSTYWIGDGPGHLNPLQEANAAKVRNDMGLTTLEREIAEYSGEDLDTNLDQLEVENNRLVSLGIKQRRTK